MGAQPSRVAGASFRDARRACAARLREHAHAGIARAGAGDPAPMIRFVEPIAVASPGRGQRTPASNAMPQVQGGKMRAYAITASKRIPAAILRVVAFSKL